MSVPSEDGPTTAAGGAARCVRAAPAGGVASPPAARQASQIAAAVHDDHWEEPSPALTSSLLQPPVAPTRCCTLLRVRTSRQPGVCRNNNVSTARVSQSQRVHEVGTQHLAEKFPARQCAGRVCCSLARASSLRLASRTSARLGLPVTGKRYLAQNSYTFSASLETGPLRDISQSRQA